jgi:tetratricopeptide (TPR) repeat protein
MSHGRN